MADSTYLDALWDYFDQNDITFSLISLDDFSL